jgi:inosine-uridine nucleoside N-ribohydrolase
MIRKIIIDTDPGQDDAMALMLACKSPKFNILAVTTVCGNSTIENTTRNARFILNFLGREDIPVYSGAEKPVSRDLVQAVIHGSSGLEGVDPVNESTLTGNAMEQMLRLIKTNPGEITIFALGPLTNIALAIQQDPSTMRLVKEIVIMGGAIDVPGNMNRVAEFNIFVDPDAADIVMRSSIVKTLVPLDVCDYIYMQIEDIERVKDNRLRTLLADMLKPYIANLEKDSGVKAALMYDPLTIFYALQPESCQTVKWHILVETKGEVTRGMTVVDKRRVSDGLKPNATVVTHIKSNDFIEYFIQTLNS